MLRRTWFFIEQMIATAQNWRGGSHAPTHFAADLYQLEARVLMSASPVVALTDAPSPDQPNGQTADSSVSATNRNSTLDAGVQAAERVVNEVVFVDGGVYDFESLLADLELQRTDGRQFDIHVLDAHRDGVEQISEILSDLTEVSAIHILSHATNGSVKLGSTWLGENELDGYSAQLIEWRSALTNQADILFYGCNLAGSDTGQALLESIAALTDSEVAASANNTGHAQFGGDWDLEFHLGIVSTEVVVGALVQDSWHDLLGVITVSTTNDVLDGDTSSVAALLASAGADGFISLREAIIATNNTAGADTIFLPDGTFAFTIGGQNENAAGTGDLDIADSLTIIGAGSGLSIIDANGLDRVIEVRPGVSATISDVTIRGGSMPSNDWGAGVLVDSGASMNLSKVVITANNTGSGAGLYNFGTLVATDTTFSNNVASDWGGGLYNDRGNMTLNRVTINGNTAGKDGGGIENAGSGAVMSLTNATLSGNTATGNGGGLWTNEGLTATNVTIAFNTAANGDGVFGQGGGSLVTFKNSVLFNPAGDNSNRTMISAGNNIDSDGTAGLPGPGNLIADPRLAPLANYGGFTSTHALLAISPAIDAGTATGAPATDQRGIGRLGATDIGAFEFVANMLIVDTTSDVADGNTGSVAALLTNKGVDGKISLREAILATNSTANLSGPDVIRFNLPDSDPRHYYYRNNNVAGSLSSAVTTTLDDASITDFDPDYPYAAHSWFRIDLNAGSSALAITSPVFIDGYSQPGATENNLVVGQNAKLRIELTSSGADGDNGLHLITGASGSTIRGLAINGFDLAGIRTDTGVNNLIVQGNFIGTDITGTVDLGNGDAGILLQSNNNQVGGSNLADRNVISGNNYSGVSIAHASADDNQVLGNYIGVKATGSGALGNSIFGVVLWDGADGNTIGGVTPGASNIIAYNNRGVVVDSNTTVSKDNSIRGNSIYGNTGLGIDLNNDGVSANDSGDFDLGANNTRNYPVIANAVISGANLAVSGTLNTIFLANCNLDFYWSPAGDSSGHGEGQVFIGTTNVTSDFFGNASFSANFGGVSIPAGTVISATATDSSGNTSEFSLNRTVTIVNTAPVLNGANNLTAINEDPTANLGTLVSALIAGQITDPDSGALAGIAVTAVNNANGTWQYSTNGGGLWTIFGSPSVSAARLLAADSNTYVRFVPNLNWNGTVAGGISFKAWDRTSGTAGSTANVSSNGGTTAFSTTTGAASITVNAVNDAPVATNNTYTVNEDNTLSVAAAGILLNDSDVEGNPLTAVIGTGPVNAASFTLNANGSFSYTPNGNFNGTDSFTYRANDGAVNSNFATVTITIAAVNDIPVITSDGGNGTASVSKAENGKAVTTVVATDPDTATQVLTYSIVAGADSAKFSINGTSGVLKFVTAPNFEVPSDIGLNNVYNLTVQVSDGNGGIDTQAISITVTDLNDTAPVVTSAQAFNVNEIAANGFALGTVLATDADTVGSLQAWAIISGNTDGIFAINSASGQLTVANNTNLNFESQSSYTLGIRVGDGVNTSATKNVAVNINNINEPPTITAIANKTILESGNTGAIAFTVGDPELAAGSLTVTATSSNQTIIPNANLVITGTGANRNITVTPVAGQSGGPVAITITVSDGSIQTQRLFDVTVVPRIITVTTPADENDGNTSDILSLLATPGGSGISLREAIIATNNTLIGATPDQIILPSGNYLLNLGALGKLSDDLLIAGGGARTTTIDAQGFHRVFEIDSSSVVTMKNITIQGGDASNGGGALVNGGSTLNLTEVRMTGNHSTNSGGAIHVHGTLNLNRVLLDNNTATDGGALGFQGADGGSLTNVTISGNSATGDGGAIHTNSAIAITNSTIANNTGATVGGIHVNGGNVALKNSILGNNGANANAALTSGGFNIDSNGTALLSGVGDQVANPLLNALANNGGQTDTHAPIGGSLAIDPAGLTGAPALDQRNVTRDATPDIGAFEGSLGSLVGSINDTDPASDQVAENSANGTTVGVVALATDLDVADFITYTLTDDAAGRFAINATTGVVTVNDGSRLNYETATSHNISVRAMSSDSSFSIGLFTINILPVNDNAPMISSGSSTGTASFDVDENTSVVTTVMATDADLPAQTLSYSIIGGPDAAAFSIDANTGVLSFVTLPDFESPTDVGLDNDYDVTVQVSDGIFSDTQDITVEIGAVNEFAPAITSNGGGVAASIPVDENIVTVTIVTATDADLPAQTLTYSIIGGVDAGNFTIDSGTGFLSFMASPDFESSTDVGGDNIYDLIVSVTGSGGMTASQTIAVTVTDVNEFSVTPLVDSNPAVNAVTEGAAAGTNVGITASASDADATLNAVTYSLLDSAAGRFAIQSSSGVVTVADGTLLDAESSTSHTIIVRATSADGSTADALQTIFVAGINDNGPVITSDGGAATALVVSSENSTFATNVTASDAESPSQTLIYSINGGVDAAKFSIDGATGLLRFVSAPNFELPSDADFNNAYEVIVEVSDGAFTAAQAIAVMVSDLNDAAVGAPTISGTAEVGQVLTADTSGVGDEDGLGSLSYQWLRAGTAIGGANSTSYVLTSTDIGQFISVEISYTDARGTPESATSSAIGPAVDFNHAPTVSLSSLVLTIDEDYSASVSMKVADVVIVDDLLGTNSVTLVGTDASLFELIAGNTELHLKPGVVLDFKTNPILYVSVLVDDPALSGSPDDLADFTLAVNASAEQIVAPPPNANGSSAPESSSNESTDSAANKLDEQASTATHSGSSNFLFAPFITPAIDQRHFAQASLHEELIELSSIDTVHESVSLHPLDRTSMDGLSDYSVIRGYNQIGTTLPRLSEANSVAHVLVDSSFLSENSQLWEKLDTLQESVQSHLQLDGVVMGSVSAVTGSLTVGYVVWIVRGGVIASTLLAQLPAWKYMDAMVVLAHVEESVDDEDGSLESIVDQDLDEQPSKGIVAESQTV